MAAPYSSIPISGYNSNPPADDGSAVSTNQITWAGNKTKLSDPIKTRTDSMDSALVTAFTKTLGGGGITSISTDYTIQSSDQGKLVKATASLALTMGDATAFLAPFCHGFVNLSGTTITVSGGGGQTIDGNASFTVAPGAGFLAFTDGANWNTSGLQGTLVGKQLMYGFILNGTIVQSNSSNAVTWSLKTLAGNDPSSTDPVIACFRNSTQGTGNYVYRAITAATSVTITSGGTMGASNNVAFRIWSVLFDDAGTIKMGVINCRSGTTLYPLGQRPVAGSTADNGSGGSTSAQVFYTKNGVAAVSSKAYVVLGYADYESGLSTAGSWNVNPDHIQCYGPGVPLPGQVIQPKFTTTGAVATGTTVVPHDNTIPQITEGDQYMSLAITASSKANLLQVDAQGIFTVATAATYMASSLYNADIDAANALVTNYGFTNGISQPVPLPLRYIGLAPNTSGTTFTVRAGGTAGNTVTFNGEASARTYGGVLNSFIQINEIMG